VWMAKRDELIILLELRERQTRRPAHGVTRFITRAQQSFPQFGEIALGGVCPTRAVIG
jgi:hypothetical protein